MLLFSFRHKLLPVVVVTTCFFVFFSDLDSAELESLLRRHGFSLRRYLG